METQWGRLVGGGSPASSPLGDAKRDLTMAKLLMGMTQQQPQNNYLASIANIASMLAFAEADKGYDAASAQVKQARLDRFGTALDGLAPELGAERVAALRGMLDPNAEDPIRDVSTMMGAFNNADRTRLMREREARIGRGGGSGGGSTLSASILSEARRLAEQNPRFLDMTPQQQIAYVRDLGRQLTRGGAAEVDPESFFPAGEEEAGRSWGEWWSENAPSWLGGGPANPAPAAETPAAASDPVRGTATALAAPRPAPAPRAAPAPVTPSTPARPAAPSRPAVPAPPAPPRPGAPATSPAGMPRVQTDAEYEALPPGTRFTDPEGNVRVKP